MRLRESIVGYVLQQNETAALQSQLSIEAQSSSPNTNTNEPIPLSKPTQVSNTDITTTVASFLAEEKEKDRRRLNLIVHQLEEPTETDAQKRKECDVKEISDIIQKYLGVSATLTNAVRLGSKGDKPRLLKISVSSRQEKTQILKIALSYIIKNTLVIFRRSRLNPQRTTSKQSLKISIR